MKYAFTFVAAILGLGFVNASSALPADEKGETQVMDGWIHSVDLKAGTFVLGGKNGSQTTFRVGVKVGEREAIILLDGKKATFQAAIQPSCEATVTFVTVGKDLWVTKLEVTSAAREPDRPRPADEK